jgi:hypothetical protein
MPCKHFTAHRAFLLLLLNGLLDGGEPELAYVLILEVWVLQMLSPVSCLNSASSRDPVERSNLSWVRPCGLPHRFLRRGPFRPAQHLAGVRKLDARYSSRREPPCMIPTKGSPSNPLRSLVQRSGKRPAGNPQAYFIEKALCDMEPATRIERATCGLRMA